MSAGESLIVALLCWRLAQEASERTPQILFALSGTTFAIDAAVLLLRAAA